ncbi:uncharacterized protein LOC124132729 [Haliotis rufescens]|uniref:uncharacterized protein LOC124132729 n=1 Tax=Haliotis rufescens TaxID=6454 RepID=UPI00201E7851|nr:uncharacterized protein LOC124132729 [Haliotis rufescens]
MKCQMCKTVKLSNEFPPRKITENCRHPRLHCMRCVVAYVHQHEACPHPDCGETIATDSQMMEILQHTLKEMFRVYDSSYTPHVVSQGASEGVIQVTVLNGESMTLPFKPNMTILQMKEEIKNKLGHEVQKQKLLYNVTELKVYGDSGQRMRLIDYSVEPNSVIHLVILMFAIPEGFDHVVFDLYWGYPQNRGRDYLDASCLQFSGQAIQHVVDYGRTQNENGSIRHSGDIMNDIQRIGHHTIHVYLRKIPANITHLFFTLSAWNSPNIAQYPNPSLSFYQAQEPHNDLCKTSFTHAKYSQAVIMCSVSRSASGWTIYESGKLSAGNAKNYNPLISTVRSLISQGY